MNTNEIARAIEYMDGLFPGQWTEEMAMLAEKDWRSYNFNRTIDGIEQYRRTAIDDGKGGGVFIVYGRLLSMIRLAHLQGKDPNKIHSEREGSWCDIRRRQNPAYKDRCDIEVILRVFRGQWHQVTSDAHRRNNSDLYRRKIVREATQHLLRVEGQTPEIAAQWVEIIFIENVDEFRTHLFHLRGDSEPV